MAHSFSDRIKSARLINAFSLEDLSNALGGKISRQALHRYETGEVMPDSEMINLLSDALNVRPDFFFRETEIEIGPIEYRKLKMPVKEENKIVELTRDYLSRYLELEEILDIPTSFENPLKNVGIVSSYQQVNNAANDLRKAWKLGCDPLYNVVELLEDKHIKIVKIDADLAFDGLQTWVNGEKIPVIAYNVRKLQKADRIRFTLLHELAHLLLDFGDITEKQKEKLCNQFAGAMLLPEESLIKELGISRDRILMEELGFIKQQYGISIQAIIMRANACGIIHNYYTSQFFFMIKQMNWNIDEPKEFDYQGMEDAKRFDQLIYRAIGEEKISLSKAASLRNQKLSEFRQHSFLI
ncbi:MAG: ImmA/IrrE family metallo-endopeptidase [Sphingobacteriales bacterium]|nr:MAG: ImmA/IrrE family metallo-endopeptidase [Sphingobacteriales bacterium]